MCGKVWKNFCLSSECSAETLINFNCDFCDFIYCLFYLHVGLLSLRFVNRNLLCGWKDGTVMLTWKSDLLWVELDVKSYSVVKFIFAVSV